jgi:hypothetical protein
MNKQRFIYYIYIFIYLFTYIFVYDNLLNIKQDIDIDVIHKEIGDITNLFWRAHLFWEILSVGYMEYFSAFDLSLLFLFNQSIYDNLASDDQQFMLKIEKHRLRYISHMNSTLPIKQNSNFF